MGLYNLLKIITNLKIKSFYRSPLWGDRFLFKLTGFVFLLFLCFFSFYWGLEIFEIDNNSLSVNSNKNSLLFVYLGMLIMKFIINNSKSTNNDFFLYLQIKKHDFSNALLFLSLFSPLDIILLIFLCGYSINLDQIRLNFFVLTYWVTLNVLLIIFSNIFLFVIEMFKKIAYFESVFLLIVTYVLYLFSSSFAKASFYVFNFNSYSFASIAIFFWVCVLMTKYAVIKQIDNLTNYDKTGCGKSKTSSSFFKFKINLEYLSIIQLIRNPIYKNKLLLNNILFSIIITITSCIYFSDSKFKILNIIIPYLTANAFIIFFGTNIFSLDCNHYDFFKTSINSNGLYLKSKLHILWAFSFLIFFTHIIFFYFYSWVSISIIIVQFIYLNGICSYLMLLQGMYYNKSKIDMTKISISQNLLQLIFVVTILYLPLLLIVFYCVNFDSVNLIVLNEIHYKIVLLSIFCLSITSWLFHSLWLKYLSSTFKNRNYIISEGFRK